METKKQRIYKYDNIRFLLIFLVIIGHEMELFKTKNILVLYKIIYSFHMPMFLYITGKFAKCDRKHTLKHLCLPYVVFQTLYICFDCYFISGEKIKLEYTTPYWILWYLMVSILCYVLMNYLPGKESRFSMLVVIMAFILSVVVGYDKTVGYYLSLSRFIVFLPFFLWGYYQNTIVSITKKYIKKLIDTITHKFPASGVRFQHNDNHKLVKLLFIIACMTICIVIIIKGELYIYHNNLPLKLFYSSKGYVNSRVNAKMRIIFILIASAWIKLLERIIPNVYIPLVSDMGQNTLPIFLFHAFIIKLMGKYKFFKYAPTTNLMIACFVAIVLIICFGNSFCGKRFKKLF